MTVSMTATASGAAAPRRRIRTRVVLLTMLVVGLLCATMLEVALRLMAGTGTLGNPMFLSVALVPFELEPQRVRSYLRDVETSSYLTLDRDLGWCVVKNGTTPQYQSNAQGVRADPQRVFARSVPAGKTRLVLVGDSFTHCDSVANHETWPHYLEQMDARLEPINLGVAAYGTDQAVLRYRRDGVAFESDFAVLGIWPENICRNLNLVRFYLAPGGGVLPKPRFKLEGERLKLVNVPVPDAAALTEAMRDPLHAPLLADEFWVDSPTVHTYLMDHLYIGRVARSVYTAYDRKALRQRFYTGEDPRANALTVAIARQFAEDVRAAGRAQPLVLLIPMRDLLDLHAQPGGFALVNALRAAGLDVMDAGPAFAAHAARHGVGSLYLPEGHLNPEGNAFLAGFVREEISRRLERRSPAAAPVASP